MNRLDGCMSSDGNHLDGYNHLDGWMHVLGQVDKIQVRGEKDDSEPWKRIMERTLRHAATD